MAELEWQGPIEPGSLQRALRQALRRAAPGWRVVAEGFLGLSTPIDLLAVGESGELICVRASTGAGDGALEEAGGAGLLASAVADLGFLGPRIEGLSRLAPELGLSPLAPPRAHIFAPGFDPEVVAAAEHLATLLGDDRLGLSRFRALRQQGQLHLLLDPLKSGPAPRSHGAHRPRVEAEPATPRLTDPPSPSAFRTGLTDADLRVGAVGGPL